MAGRKIKNKTFRNGGVSHRGFSLLESLLSIFLVTVGIVAVLALFSGAITQTLDSKNQQIAVSLAEEGMELVRNIRDNNWAAGKDSFDSIDPGTGSKNCSFDINSNINCSNPDGRLYLDANNFYNSSSSGAETSFRRLVKITKSGENLRVVSKVAWGGATPPDNEADCSTSSKCAYTAITLTRWGEL